MHRSHLAVAAASAALVAAPFAGLLLLGGPAAADDYQMRIVSTPALSPSSLTVHPVDRVVFTNSTASTWRVTVGSSYDIVLFPGQSADGSGVDPDPYSATALGTYHVMASSPSRQANITGTIVVRSAATSSPAPTPAPTTASPPPKPPPAAGMPSTPAPPPSASSLPSAANASASPSGSRSPGAPAAASPARSVGAVAVGPVAPSSGPAPASRDPSAQAFSGPVQHFGNSGVALPGAVAAVLLAGLLAAIVRVLLAEPVEDSRLR